MLESGASTGRIVVIDLGKTLSKVSLWTRSGRLVDRRVRPTTPLVVDGIWRLDVTGVERWLVDALRGFAAHPIDTIIPVGHGAGVLIAQSPAESEHQLPRCARSLCRDRLSCAARWPEPWRATVLA